MKGRREGGRKRGSKGRREVGKEGGREEKRERGGWLVVPLFDVFMVDSYMWPDRESNLES